MTAALTWVVIVASSTAPAALVDPEDELDEPLLAMPLLDPDVPDVPDELMPLVPPVDPDVPDELMPLVPPVDPGVDDAVDEDVLGDVLLVEAFLSALRWSQPAAKSTELAASAASSCIRVRVFIRWAPS